MATKPLYDVPAKPRGLEAITIERSKFIKLLKEERVRQARRASQAKRAHRQAVTIILQNAIKTVKAGGMPGRSKYSDQWILELPKPPVFSPCNYDQTIHRLEQDDRETITLSAASWNEFFPCDIKTYDEED